MQAALDFLTANPWAAWLAFGLFSLVLSKQSQIDAWVEQHPRLAGFMKLLRSLGFDPWMAVQAVSLLVKKRLPVKLQAAKIIAEQDAPPLSKEVAAEVRKQSEPPPSKPPSSPGGFSLLVLLGLSLVVAPALPACSGEQPVMRAPTRDELELACPEAAKVSTVDCPALAVSSCRGFESLDECPAGESVRQECSRLREEALSQCR